MRLPFPLLAATLAVGSAPAAEPAGELAAAAQKVFATHCGRCHGQNGTVEGGLNYVADLPRLVARKKVTPGHPDGSPVFRRMADGTMPPPDDHPRPSAADLAAVRRWIEAGATVGVSPPARPVVTTADVQAAVLADLEAFDRRPRRFQRYFTLHHLHNAGLSDGELGTHRNALGKLLNSLSWHPDIRRPEPIDAARTVYRIDLRWYQWDAALWNRLLQDYPYGIQDDTAVSRAVAVGTGTRMPVVRADWFVAAASRAPLYYDLLQMPGNLAELERALRVDARQNILQDRVMRAGFNGSGVSRFNRVLERHDAAHGPYWRTYDFDEPPQNLIDRGTGLLPDRRNVFAHPLGPGLTAEPFQHAGGEAIFALPNGLHAYYVMNAVNDRLDKAPQAIVSDPKRPDRAVEAGVSCMSCHVTGILPKADQVRDHLAKNPASFSRTDGELIRGLYPPKDATLAKMADDAKKYAAAVEAAGAKVSRTEAVSTITLRYEADLDLPLAAAEVGLSPEALREKIAASGPLTRSLGALRVPGGTVSRQVWLQTFGDLARDLRLGTLFTAAVASGLTADAAADADPLEQPGNVVNALAFRPDGRRALLAMADKSVRVRDVETGQDVTLLVGHAGSVWAAAYSRDGTRAVSGGADGTVRVWDAATGSELRTLSGHDALVSAVALSADGSRALSGGYDGSVVWWDAVGGRELRRLDGAAKYVHAADLHPAKKRAAVAADRSVLVWEYSTGDIVRRWEAHAGAVTCVRYFEGGKLLVTGGDDRRVRVWDADAGKLLADLAGHDGGVRGLDLKPGGRWLLSASADRTVRLWDLTTKTEAAAFRKHDAGAVAAAFLPSGVRTLSGDRDGATRIWDVSRWLTGGPGGSILPPEPPAAIPRAE